MALSITRLEQEIKEHWLLLGEQLLDRQQVTDLRQIDKQLWTAQVDGYEVELQVASQKLLAYTCECPKIKEHHFCEHIVAGTLFLRSFLQEERLKKQVEQQKKAEKEHTPKKLTVPFILKNISEEELKAFVGQYARTNRNFAIALKTRFAGAVPMENKRDKYLQLLDTAINAARNKNDKLTVRGAQKIVKVVRELNEQAGRSLAEGHPVQAVYILTSVLEKTAPLIRKTSGKGEPLESSLLESLNYLQLLTKQQLAPKLEEDVWKFCLREAEKSTLQQTRLLPAFYRLLPLLARDAAQREELRHFFVRERPKTRTNSPERTELLIQQFQLLEKDWPAEEVERFLIDHLEEPNFVKYAIHQALKNQQNERAAFLADKGLEFIADPKSRIEIQQISLELALQRRQHQKASGLAQTLFLETKDLQFLQTLRKNAGSDWEELVDLLLNELESQPFSRQKRDAISYLLATEGRLEQLFQYIERTQSLDLLQRYDLPLQAQDKSRLFQLYEELLVDYLNNHFGRKPSARVRELLLHLQQEDMSELLQYLLDLFRKQFAERHSLMEELAFFEQKNP